MKANNRQIDGITIVDLSGRIVLGEDTALLRKTVRDLIAGGHKRVLLNLAEVPFIDSSGIGELVSAFTAVRREGGDVKLLKLTRRVSDVLQIVKLETVFDVFNDEAAAIQSFAR
ncbi:MAG TPA: STAS domain-containing protein [Candidatus Saccharimonadales bacterium]|nr:STAS domain-containing protein [Candidatus Saccharimonadales bacterium]